MRTFDYKKWKDVKWDSEIVSLIAKIREYKGEHRFILKERGYEVENLVEAAKRESTEASNAIEGIRTTSSRLKQLYAQEVLPKNCAEEEILGYRDVLNLIDENYNFIPININHILQLHRDLYKYSEKSIGGHFKQVQNFITAFSREGKPYTIFTPLPPYETKVAIESICENYNKVIEDESIDPLLLIPIFIHDFLCIHPFTDGNGRMSRLLTTLLLYKSEFFVGKYVSIERKVEKSKDIYYEVLEACQIMWHEEAEDKSLFIKYFLRILLASYKELEEKFHLISKRLPAKEMVNQISKNRVGKFTKSEIARLCPRVGVKSIELALKELVNEGILEKKGSGRASFYIKKV